MHPNVAQQRTFEALAILSERQSAIEAKLDTLLRAAGLADELAITAKVAAPEPARVQIGDAVDRGAPLPELGSGEGRLDLESAGQVVDVEVVETPAGKPGKSPARRPGKS